MLTRNLNIPRCEICTSVNKNGVCSLVYKNTTTTKCAAANVQIKVCAKLYTNVQTKCAL